MVTTTSMPFPALEPTSCPTVAASSLQTSRSSADADARRLAAAVARGDEAAFRQLYDRYQPRLFRLALVLGRGDESLAQDTVQSVFVTAAAKLRRVDGEEHLWNWLARVARQQLAKAWRQQKQDPAMVGMADLPEHPDAVKPDSVLAESLDAALLARHLELQRYHELSDLSDDELERLLPTARQDTQELLATLGYFSSEISIERKVGADSTAARSSALFIGRLVPFRRFTEASLFRPITRMSPNCLAFER